MPCSTSPSTPKACACAGGRRRKFISGTSTGVAVEADPVLAEALEPREPDAGRYGIVLDEPVRARLHAALGA